MPCGSPKLCPPVISTAYSVVFHRRDAITTPGDNHLQTPFWHVTSPPARPAKPASRKLGLSPTTRSLAEETSQAQTGILRQDFLGIGAKTLVRLEASSHCRQPRDGGEMAPNRIRPLLALNFQNPEGDRKKKNLQRGARSDLPDGRRESDLGSAAHPRGASHVGIRCFRANNLPAG